MIVESRDPIDKIAAIVVSKVKDQQTSAKTGHRITSMIPLPITSWYGRKKDDLTGLQIGRLTVIGPSLRRANIKDGNGSKWVTKCKCGRYSTFKNRTLKNKKVNCCHECNHILNLKNNE